ncbi:vesicular, overexpressed in cancer, prosurvival protein 1-like [Elysia marginata]|uniref:WW domain binding protein VOPP1 n=1 Tax=Elysia marginata TaxID=1093978 RepID=A0AAV4IBS9_9GAST|nr:vesicular, overexpressed in cancer, prosurvival protein 1-like [Elysia marginata]
MSTLVILGFLSLLSEVFAEHCMDDTYCHSPSKCCETKRGCCYDSLMQSKHFRLQVWNMWYFWFLVIFMMMSCFGGCGYYRRRRLAMLSRSPVSSPTGHSPSISPSQPGDGRSRGQERHNRQYNLFAYSGSSNVGMYPIPQYHQPTMVASMPPAYNEVVNQPSLYPVNGKSVLPPYEEQDKTVNNQLMPSGGASVWPVGDSSLPPPYTEFAADHNPDPPLPHQQRDVSEFRAALSGPSPSQGTDHTASTTNQDQERSAESHPSHGSGETGTNPGQ